MVDLQARAHQRRCFQERAVKLLISPDLKREAGSEFVLDEASFVWSVFSCSGVGLV